MSRLALVAHAISWLLATVGFALGALPLALGGLMLLVLLLTRRAPKGEVEVTYATEGTFRQGQIVKIMATARCKNGAIDGEIQLPVGTQLISKKLERVLGESTFTVEWFLEDAGALDIQFKSLQIQDSWGVASRNVAIPVPVTKQVNVDEEWVVRGRRIGRQAQPKMMATLLGSQPRLEFRGIRDYRHGDRAKDIDWVRSLRGRGLVVREREMENPTDFTVVLPMTDAVLERRRRSRSLTGLRIAYGALEAAQSIAMRPRIVTDFNGELELFEPRGGQGLESIFGALARRIKPIPFANRKFIMDFEELSAKIRPGGIVLYLGPISAELPEVLANLSQKSGVFVMTYKDGPYHFLSHERGKKVLPILKANFEARKEIVSALQSYKIPVLELGPGEEELAIQKVKEILT